MQEPNKQTTKQAVLYCRVSTTEQADEGNSLTTQEKACREYAIKNGFDVPDGAVFIERGECKDPMGTAQRCSVIVLKKNAISGNCL